jgi:hypothetical protein
MPGRVLSLADSDREQVTRPVTVTHLGRESLTQAAQPHRLARAGPGWQPARAL